MRIPATIVPAVLAASAVLSGGVLAQSPSTVFDVLGPMFVAWIETTRDAAHERGAEVIPEEMRDALTGHVPEQVLDNVRWLVDDSWLSMPQNLFRLGYTTALTVDSIILFADIEAAADPVLWAHEMFHVMQYRNWGVHGFAERYLAEHGAVEHEANEFVWQWMEATDRVPAIAPSTP